MPDRKLPCKVITKKEDETGVALLLSYTDIDYHKKREEKGAKLRWYIISRKGKIYYNKKREEIGVARCYHKKREEKGAISYTGISFQEKGRFIITRKGKKWGLPDIISRKGKIHYNKKREEIGVARYYLKKREDTS